MTRPTLHRLRSGSMLLLLLAIGVLWVKPMGLLIWGRMRILTNIPRTAIAEPETRLVEGPRIELPPKPVVEKPRAPGRDPFRSRGL